MTEQDTIHLLRECDAGIKMGIASIEAVLDYVQNSTLKQALTECRASHQRLQDELQHLLKRHHDEGKDPGSMAKSMSWVKTNVKLVLEESDQTIADLMTDGCNMGVKSLNRYLNQYREADAPSRDIARRLSDLEEHLVVRIRPFL
jgi:hypothetical protein